MSTIWLLLAVLLSLNLGLLWGFLAMASWSDRQLARAWQEANPVVDGLAD